MARPTAGTTAAFLARFGLLGLSLAACALLVIAEFSTLYEVKTITVVQETSTAGEHHAYALLILGAAAAAMAVGATLGSSRPAAIALLVLALAALGVTLIVDYPDVESTGLTELYEQAKASPKIGFYLETLGAALLLLCAVATLVLGHGRPSRESGHTGDVPVRG